MSTRPDRAWMYNRGTGDGFFNSQFAENVRNFLDFAFSQEERVEKRRTPVGTIHCIRCPCTKCKLVAFHSWHDVQEHLVRRGFMPNYTTWYEHGESHETTETVHHVGQTSYKDWDDSGFDGCTQMVVDHIHPTQAPHRWEEQSPNPDAKKLYEMLQAADEPLWDGCQNFSKLEAATRLLNWKSEYNISEAAYNALVIIIKEMLPDGKKLIENFYETKKMLNLLALPKERIHACKNHCMIFYKGDSDLQRCRVCLEPRYKTSGRGRVPNMVLTYLPIAPRIQRLYMSTKTAKEMTWHNDHRVQDRVMVHPSDGQAWKHFDKTHPSFAAEVRNVRLGLCTDGFSPNNSNSNPHSTWPVFFTIYNLPPWLALKDSYVKLALLIPGRKSPGQNLDVFLQPLIDELKMLWNDGVVTYDAFRRNNFIMKAIVLWTVSDFPAYAMLSGWSTHGKLACPYCMRDVDSFTLEYGGKPCWFDCHRRWLPMTHRMRKDQKNFLKGKKIKLHPPTMLTGHQIWEQVRHLPTVYEGAPHQKGRKINGFGTHHNWVKRSIFWELPYWQTLLIRHNLDVMHIERNVFENIFNTVMDTLKTKDNNKARRDLQRLCDRSGLHLRTTPDNKVRKPKATYTLQKDQVKSVCGWLKTLKFPDGYASNIGSCVNIESGSFYGFKSHDCHVFMQRLLPIALKGMIPRQIWDAITELCTFFRVICSRTLQLDDLEPLQARAIEIICNLEKIFPPGLFDSMEHLIIHLTREAICGGPVQYRWMYLYERKLGSLKRTIRNKARVEGSIVESYLANELAMYCSLYFESNIITRHTRVPRNYAPDMPSSLGSDFRLSIFKVPCRKLFEKGGRQKYLDHDEMHKAHTYILLNCMELQPLICEFDDKVRAGQPDINDEQLSRVREKEFSKWFETTVLNTSHDSYEHLKVLAYGPRPRAIKHKGYFVNGYKFHTQSHGAGRVTNNSGVCVKGSCYGDDEMDYYGVLDEVLEFEYLGEGRCIVVLFKCTWFDNIQGVRKDKHNLVEIRHKSRLKTNDPFILASQAQQVYYTSYPSPTRELKDWWAVVKTKPRGIYEVAERANEVEDDDNMDGEHFFQMNEECVFSTASTSVGNDNDLEYVPLVTDQYIEVNTDDDEEEEFHEDTDEDSDENDEDEIELSDHSSDE